MSSFNSRPCSKTKRYIGLASERMILLLFNKSTKLVSNTISCIVKYAYLKPSDRYTPNNSFFLLKSKLKAVSFPTQDASN